MAGPFLRDCEKKILFSKFSFNIYKSIKTKKIGWKTPLNLMHLFYAEIKEIKEIPN